VDRRRQRQLLHQVPEHCLRLEHPDVDFMNFHFGRCEQGGACEKIAQDVFFLLPSFWFTVHIISGSEPDRYGFLLYARSNMTPRSPRCV
jgi:hypothetical protein